MKKIINFSSIVILFVFVSAFSAKAQEIKDYFRGMPIEKIEISGSVTLKIKHSDDTHLKLSTGDINSVEVSCKSGVLKVNCKNIKGASAEVYIHKELEKISLKKGAILISDEALTFKKIKFELDNATINNIQMIGKQATFSTKGSNISDVTLNVENVIADFGKTSSFKGTVANAKSVKISSDTKSNIEVKGKTQKLSIDSDGATVNASELEAGSVDVKLQDYANVSVFADEKLNVNITSAAILKHKGMAQIKMKKTVVGAVITKE